MYWMWWMKQMHLIKFPSHTPDTDMDETNLTNPFEHEHTNNTNENMNDMNDNTMQTQNPS